MRFERGCLVVGRVRGAPVVIHWSWPIGAVVFTRFRLEPLAWLGFALLTLVHELGHAFWVKRFRLYLERIVIHGLGGECQWAGRATPLRRSIIAWGGVMGQILLLPIGFFGPLIVSEPALVPLFDTLAWTNLHLMAVVLLPIAPLDGAEAWSIIGIWRRSWRERRAARARAASRVFGGDHGVNEARARAAQRDHVDREAARERQAAIERQVAVIERQTSVLDLPEDEVPPLPDEVLAQLESAMGRAHAEPAKSADSDPPAKDS